MKTLGILLVALGIIITVIVIFRFCIFKVEDLFGLDWDDDLKDGNKKNNLKKEREVKIK